MNFQSNRDELMLITEEQARVELYKLSQIHSTHVLEYYAWPRMYGNTAGPFSYSGRVSCQAMTTFTLEAWSDGVWTVIFCQGKIIEVKEFKGGFKPMEYR